MKPFKLKGFKKGSITENSDEIDSNESLYRILIENLPQKIFCKNRESIYLSMNEAFAADLKIKPAECIGKTDYDFFPKELAEKYRADDLRIMNAGEIETIEEEYLQEGELHTVLTSKVPLRSHQGNIKGIMGIFFDITEQKKAESNLKKQQKDMIIRNKIAQIFLNTPDENMFGEILKVILEVTDSKLGVFGYIDENGDLIVPSMTREAWWDQCNVPDKDIKFPCDSWGDGTWPRALREKKPNFTNEISKKVPKGHIPINRHMTMPILYRGESIGLIQVANRETDYDEKDIKLLEDMVSLIAPNLIVRLQRDREEKKRKILENQISETVEVLAEVSSTILSATTQVASSIMETTTAINETSATVEEVRQSARVSSEKAKNVSDNAQQAAQASQSGQKAVEENSVIMNKIREQMDSIAQTIVQLSEQSQSIGGIIASVTDIADQSNLLAVNAAIEAARAGEQGKSFAVVAQEIKNLATQSKQATTQVRNILNDIQKATAEAVMATERGSKAVETGVKQSKLTSEAIDILTENSKGALTAASQIVASSQQQVVGMDQIGVAIQNINQAGSETTTSMTQTETSAKNLHELGQKLKEMVERFNK